MRRDTGLSIASLNLRDKIYARFIAPRELLSNTEGVGANPQGFFPSCKYKARLKAIPPVFASVYFPDASGSGPQLQHCRFSGSFSVYKLIPRGVI